MNNSEEMIELYKRSRVIVDLIDLKEDSRLTAPMKDQIRNLESGLQFLMIYNKILSFFDSRLPDGKFLNSETKKWIRETLKKKRFFKIGVLALETGDFKDWDEIASELLEEINGYKQYIREDMFYFTDGLFQEYFFSVNSLMKFLRFTHVSMTNVEILVHMNPDEKKKFEFLKEKLDMLRIVFDYVKESEIASYDFEFSVNAWVWNAAYLCLFYWVLDENMASEGNANVMLSKLYRNFDFPHPEIMKLCVSMSYSDNELRREEIYKLNENVISHDMTRMCLKYLKLAKPSADKRLEAGAAVFRFIEFLFWNFKAYFSNDAIEILHDAMTFLIAFVMDPPPLEDNEVQLVLSQAQKALKQVVTLVISIGSGGEKDIEVGIVEVANFLLDGFFETVITIKKEVRRIYSHFFLDPSFNFPRINMLNLFDSSIENLKEFPSRFSNRQILTIEKGLVVLRDLFKSLNLENNYVSKLQNEHIESKDLLTRIANVVHQVDRIFRSYETQDSLGLYIFFLLDVKKEIKLLLSKVKRIKDKHVEDSYTCRSTHDEMSLNPDPLKSYMQETDEVVVGFEGKAKDIRDWLTSGSKKLDIVSIIGMAGLGKTTLAKKVYNDLSIKRHFIKCAWCTVSQSYDNKMLLLDILKDVAEVNDRVTKMEEEDLAKMLRQSLMGQRYLIVMDDIWDIGAWNALQMSFPNEENSSRILFTTRIHKVVLNAKLDSYPYVLTQLSDQESWELLERKLFNDKDTCSSDFVTVGWQIANDCKGLPLAVVLVAGLLKKEIDNLDWWKEIGKSLDSKISKEGCAHILELSYKHLSNPLKACFLYLGLFKEDKMIQVQKLVNLWVSEGFIQNEGIKDVESVAKEYLLDLIGRSLIIVCNKNSSGGIKTCRIHDLLREFCLTKSEEEHFFNLLPEKNVSHYMIGDHYRVSIQSQHWNHYLIRKSSPLYSIRICPTSTYNEFNIHISSNSFCNAKYLHVLDLEEAKFLGDFPEEITTLIFLRYLAIWCTTKFIPATIARLENLETLRIIRKEAIILPAEILRMENLRHVYIGKFFPHFLLGNILPMKNIRSFSTPCLTYGKTAETFLSKLGTIQKLKCEFDSSGQNQMVKLDFLNQLESLNLSHHGYPMLCNFMFSLPTNIKKLTLSKLGLPWSEISRVAELPNLEVLKLLVDAFSGESWTMEEDEEFKKLKFLKLQSLDVHIWSASPDNFPSLEQLVVEQCRKLEEVPITFGDILKLRKIQIRRCGSSVVNSIKKIQDQQNEFGNYNFKIEAVQILAEKLYGSDMFSHGEYGYWNF